MPRIVVENVTKTIRGRRVLNGVSLALEGGRIYGLTGPNGSGKTMLLRALCGLIYPDRGSVTVDGRRLHRDIPFPPGRGVLIGHMELLPGFTAYENLKLLAKIKKTADDAMIRAALHDLGLDPDSRARVRTLSLGQEQRLAIAQALFEDPAILLLDEPADALDRDGTALIRDLLLRERERGKLIVMASHSREDIECLADTVIGAEKGRFAVPRP